MLPSTVRKSKSALPWKRTDFLVQCLFLRFRHSGKFLVPVPDLSGIGLCQTDQHVEQHCLAGTAGSDQHIALAGAERH